MRRPSHGRETEVTPARHVRRHQLAAGRVATSWRNSPMPWQRGSTNFGRRCAIWHMELSSRSCPRVFAHSRGGGTSPVRPDPGSGNAALAPRAKGPHAQDTTHFLCMFSCALERNAVLTFLGVVACATRTSTIVRRPGRRITPTSHRHDMSCMGRKSEDLKRTGRGMAPVWASRQHRACGYSSCGGAWLGAQRQAVGQWPSEAARRPR